MHHRHGSSPPCPLRARQVLLNAIFRTFPLSRLAGCADIKVPAAAAFLSPEAFSLPI
jgi:hypothetical protein